MHQIQFSNQEIDKGIDFVQELIHKNTPMFLLSTTDSLCRVRFLHKGNIYEGILNITSQMIKEGFPHTLPMVYARDISTYLYPIAMGQSISNISKSAITNSKIIYTEHPSVKDTVCSLYAAIQLSKYEIETPYRYYLAKTVEGQLKLLLGSDDWINQMEDLEMIIWDISAPRYVDIESEIPSEIELDDVKYTLHTQHKVSNKEGAKHYKICKYLSQDGRFSLGSVNNEGVIEVDMYCYLYSLVLSRIYNSYYKNYKNDKQTNKVGNSV